MPCPECGKDPFGTSCPDCGIPSVARDPLKWLPEWQDEGPIPELGPGLQTFLESFDTLAKDDNSTPGWRESVAFFQQNGIRSRYRPGWMRLWRAVRDEQRADLRRRRESSAEKQRQQQPGRRGR